MPTSKFITAALLAAFSFSASACSFMMRDTETYKQDTSQMLDARNAELQACYDEELTRNPAMAGKLTVTFTVEKKTGKVTQLSWDKSRTTVSESLATCVVSAIENLELSEPDQRDGVATFSYNFNNPNATEAMNPPAGEVETPGEAGDLAEGTEASETPPEDAG